MFWNGKVSFDFKIFTFTSNKQREWSEKESESEREECRKQRKGGIVRERKNERMRRERVYLTNLSHAPCSQPTQMLKIKFTFMATN